MMLPFGHCDLFDCGTVPPFLSFHAYLMALPPRMSTVLSIASAPFAALILLILVSLGRWRGYGKHGKR